MYSQTMTGYVVHRVFREVAAKHDEEDRLDCGLPEGASVASGDRVGGDSQGSFGVGVFAAIGTGVECG